MRLAHAITEPPKHFWGTTQTSVDAAPAAAPGKENGLNSRSTPTNRTKEQVAASTIAAGKKCNIKGQAQQRLLGGEQPRVGLQHRREWLRQGQQLRLLRISLLEQAAMHALEGYSKPSYIRRTKEEETTTRGATPNLQGMAKSHRPRQEMETPHQQMKE